jgi:NAD(P)-dependent dehydrogenase (short-subunit alcohol dehydrogenase family)
MARIFITGSADGLGLTAGALLATQGHDALPHARLADRWLRRDLSNLEAADSEPCREPERYHAILPRD